MGVVTFPSPGQAATTAKGRQVEGCSRQLMGLPAPSCSPGAEQDSLREVMYSGALPGPRGRASS